MEVLGVIIFILFIAGNSFYYFKITPEKTRTAWKLRCILRGGLSYLVIFIAVNSIIDDHMPQWFYKFIMEHGDFVGAFLIMILATGLNALAAKLAFLESPKN